MDLEKDSGKVGVCNYFANPIHNKTALQCYGDVDNADYSGFDSDLSKYLNEKSISEMIKVNSEITRILGKFKISIRINMGILNNLVRNHLPQTRDIAVGIADNLPQEIKPAVNKKALIEATSLHDIAKVIMPESIINKAGALTAHERQIMEEHAALSYEMLKTTDLSEETLKLIKHHHHAPHKTEHTNPNNNLAETINLQILSISDIYSALREKRSYKAAMSKEKALEIINKETQEGKFHPCVYNALVKYTEQNEEKLNNRNSKWKIFNLKPVDRLSA